MAAQKKQVNLSLHPSKGGTLVHWENVLPTKFSIVLLSGIVLIESFEIKKICEGKIFSL